MATRPLLLNLPGELIDALDEVATRYATTIGALAEQALVQLLLQHGRPDIVDGTSGDDLEALLDA